jgi:hypothetical protein
MYIVVLKLPSVYVQGAEYVSVRQTEAIVRLLLRISKKYTNIIKSSITDATFLKITRM